MIGFSSIFILKLKEIQFIIKSSLQKEIVEFFVKYDVLSQEETKVVFSVVFYMCYDSPNHHCISFFLLVKITFFSQIYDQIKEVADEINQ